MEFKPEDLESVYGERITRAIGCFSLFNIGLVLGSVALFAIGIYVGFSHGG